MSILSFIYPPKCPYCLKVMPDNGNGFCNDCKKSIDVLSEKRTVCDNIKINEVSNYNRPDLKPLSEQIFERNFLQNKENDCGNALCLANEDDKVMRKIAKRVPRTGFQVRSHNKIYCISAFKYKSVVKDAIIRYKFKNQIQYANMFALDISNQFKRFCDEHKFDMLTCIPLSKLRYRDRGYNQSEVLAKKLSKKLKVKYKNLLVKIKENKIQHNLNIRDRASNVIGVYGAQNQKYIEGKSIILCDDIITTGNTLKEGCRVLLNSGAKDIICVTIASVLLEDSL